MSQNRNFKNNYYANHQILGTQENGGNGLSSNGSYMILNSTMSLCSKKTSRGYPEERGSPYLTLTDLTKHPQSVRKESPSSHCQVSCNTSNDLADQQRSQVFDYESNGTPAEDTHTKVRKLFEATDCFTPLVLTAMESMPSHHMTRDQICTWLLENFQGFMEFPLYHLRNKVTATLYLTGLFVKCCNKVVENEQYWRPIARQHKDKGSRR